MKNIMPILLASTLTLTSTAAWAEPKVYVRSNGQFVANGNEYPRGIWIPGITGAEEVFAGDPTAAQEYQDHLADAKWFGILGWGALGAFATYAIISAANDKYDHGAGMTVLVVPLAAGFYMGARSNSHLLKAINIINGVPAAQASASPTEILPEARGERHAAKDKTWMVPLLAWSF